jgi:hypothetical protein
MGMIAAAAVLPRGLPWAPANCRGRLQPTLVLPGGETHVWVHVWVGLLCLMGVPPLKPSREGTRVRGGVPWDHP